MWWEKLKTEILDTDLYSRSGTEVGVSQGTLQLVEKDGDYLIVKTGTSDIPEVCYRASCDREVNYPKLNRLVFGHLPKNWLVGEYQAIFVGHINDEEIRRNAGSGGILSGTQFYLLEKGLVDGVITLKMREDKPYFTEPIIATTKKEVLSGAQSKYATAPLNQILAYLPGSYSSLVYTGLPPEVAAIRKLQQLKHESVKNINYVLGTFYGEAISFEAIRSFLRARGVKDLNQVKSLAYRAGEWPGYLRIELKDGRLFAVKKFYANYLIPSYITSFSLYQVDYMNELADIAVGDAWAPVYEKMGQGWSVIIARSEKGLKLLQEMNYAGVVHLEKISEKDLINMHSHGLDFKKRGSFIRIASRKKRGFIVPEYGYEPVNIPAGRVRFEKILGWLFKFFQAKITIFILEKIPTAFIGWFFVKARDIWKQRTRSTKKGGLEDLRFRVYGE